jgi:hypothetical protein
VMSSRALGDRREAATCYAACRQASWRVHHGGATAQRRCGRRSGAGEQHAIATKGQPMERTRQGGGGGVHGDRARWPRASWHDAAGGNHTDGPQRRSRAARRDWGKVVGAGDSRSGRVGGRVWPMRDKKKELTISLFIFQ